MSVIGIASLYNSGAKQKLGAVAVRTMFLKVVGVTIESEGAGRANSLFTPEEEEKFVEMSRDPRIYDRMVSCCHSLWGLGGVCCQWLACVKVWVLSTAGTS